MSKTKYIPAAATSQRYDKTRRTLDRWVKDTELGFPQPMIINGRWFFALDELEAWERSRAISSIGKAA